MKDKNEPKRVRRSPKDVTDPDMAFKSTLTVAVDRPTAVAAKTRAINDGVSVSSVVREALVRFLGDDLVKA